MNAATPPPLPPLPQSRFVKLVAWITIALCAIGLLFLVLEIVAVVALTRGSLGALLQQQLARNPEASAFMAALSRWLPWVLGVIVAQLTLHLVVAIGLLRRREGARRAFVAVLWLDAIWQIAMIPMQWWLVERIQTLMASSLVAGAGSDPRMQAQLQSSQISSHVFGVVSACVFAGLYLWLAKAMAAPRVCAEFATPGSASPAVR